MLTFSKIDPTLIEIGPLKLCWYGVMYVLGFLASYFLIGRQKRARRLEILAVWHGGISFHGGLIGVVAAVMLFYRLRTLPFWDVADAVIVTAPVGLCLGRLGIFINGELYDRPSSVPWAMVFPTSPPVPRHPSQLYEAALERVVLFLILWWLKDSRARSDAMVCLFLGGLWNIALCGGILPQPKVGISVQLSVVSY